MVRFYSCFLILSFYTRFYVGSYILAESKNNLLNDDFRETKEIQAPQYELDSNRKYQSDLSNFKNENRTPKVDALAEGEEKKRKWSSILTFDRLKNLTEKDKGPCNDTKLIFINLEDHLTIYENDDDEDEIGLQDHYGQRFNLLSPEGFLSRIHSSEEKSLERTKRQAENGKRKCRCRRKGRRGMRRRRRRRRGRRRRVGQTRPARRRRRGRRRGAGRRRGRRRCVCRKKDGDEGEGKGEGDGDGDGDGEGDGEEEEEEKGDEDAEDEEEESTTTEGEEGADNDEEGEEGDEEGEEDEDSEEDEDTANEDSSDEKGGSEGGSGKNEVPSITTNHEAPVYVMYPGASGAYGPAPNAGGGPMYTALPIPFSPYPYYSGSHAAIYRKNHNLSKV